jgi:hypothetical protein
MHVFPPFEFCCVIHGHSEKIYEGMKKDGAQVTPPDRLPRTHKIALAVSDIVRTLAKDEGNLLLGADPGGFVVWAPSAAAAMKTVEGMAGK